MIMIMMNDDDDNDDEDDEDDDDREHLEAGHEVHVWDMAAHLPWASYHCSAHSGAEEKEKKNISPYIPKNKKTFLYSIFTQNVM